MININKCTINKILDKKKIVIFGTGNLSKETSKLPIEISYYVDNNSFTWDKQFLGKKVFNPKKLLSEKKDDVFILVASMYYLEIYKQLQEMGFSVNTDFVFSNIILEEYLSSSLEKSLVQFKNKHIGKRAFIIGNGPSLSINDLTNLKNEITFACNKIYLAFESTNWRPTYYCAVDPFVIENNKKEIENLNLIKFIPFKYRNIFSDFEKNYYFNQGIPPIENDIIQYQFSKDITKNIYAEGTVTYSMLQIAYYMGIEEIYLIGIDHTYNIPTKQNKLSDGRVVVVNQEELNHFDPNYRKKGECWSKPSLDRIESVYELAKKKYCEDSRKIFNASRKTKLNIFPLANLDDII